ncbi:hypothetical protein CN326_22285 [Bacillus sp. AFS018417]|uniref:DUF2690 domain-containing protein n=1 Tax=Bacillus sp. AFS018417 TaxID=2033491 RepID=UPI000BF714E5|nr:DUF2690 domain-containing protein [Bacillus sp. AFS018417]PEZ00756.1 hypothetical protein CN326_22285 [Bacillus sp. AFS018417]
MFCLAAVLSLSTMLFNVESAMAATFRYDGTDPYSTGCARSAVTVDSLNLNGATLELRYSTSCRTIWTRITQPVPRDYDWGGSEAKIVRNYDGKSYRCTVQMWKNSCNTLQVNDANMTSYAWGMYDKPLGPVVTGRTGSY